jgi:hydrogenase expression/formation protein HypC
MCVGMPAKVMAISGGVMPMAQVELAGETVECCLVYLPEAEVGDYVLLQNGFAMQLLDAQSAAESLAAFAELGVAVVPPGRFAN